MKLIHISDLHIGKRVNEVSMLQDQKYILMEVLNIADKEKIDGVIIAGDIYDKSVPSAEAVLVFDDFLTRLSQKNYYTFIISGNHDSPERIAFGSKLLNKNKVFISPVYSGKINPVVIEDEYGVINFYLIPFIKPANVRKYYEDMEISNYSDAMKIIVNSLDMNVEERNIGVVHQLVTGAGRCDSEDISVGGLDNIDIDVFDEFDYVALGHIHGPQNIGEKYIRYCGTPLKYSASESSHNKSITIVEIKEKGNVQINTIPLIPLHDMRKIKGKYMDLMNRNYYEQEDTDDYIYVTLTDEEEIPEAIGKMKSVYPNIMKLEYDNTRTRTRHIIEGDMECDRKTPLEMFEELFELQNNTEMNDEQTSTVKRLISEIWEVQ